MGRYRITRRINARPDQVYRAVTDPLLVADWMDASDVREATGPLEVAGTRYTLVIRGPHRFGARSCAPSRVGCTRLWAGDRSVRIAWWQHCPPTTAPRIATWTTEYALPLGPIGRWVDRRWIDHEPRTIANREVDRLVSLVTSR